MKTDTRRTVVLAVADEESRAENAERLRAEGYDPVPVDPPDLLSWTPSGEIFVIGLIDEVDLMIQIVRSLRAAAGTTEESRDIGVIGFWTRRQTLTAEELSACYRDDVIDRLLEPPDDIWAVGVFVRRLDQNLAQMERDRKSRRRSWW